MNTYITEFETWLQTEDKGEKTIRTYLSVMDKFISWYEQTEGTEFEPQNVSPILLQDYRTHLANVLEQKPATVNKAIATIKTFFGWAVEASYISANPAIKVKMKRVQQTNGPKWLTEQEQNRLLLVLDTERNEFKHARDHAVLLTMLKAGLRVEEVSSLKINHLDLKSDTITVVNGKGGKYRIVPLNRGLKKAVKTWLTYRDNSEKSYHQSSDYLFVSERSGQMTTRAIAFMVDKYLERCGLLERSEENAKLDGQHSCHSLRHTFCKSLINQGVPIQNVARLAGHDSIQTTLRYVEPSAQDLKKAIESI